MISKQVIEEIKYRNEIRSVISEYMTLKRAGSNMNGLCPFHSEKTPSFTVFTGTSSYYCFGCGAGGDVITFIMNVENLDYADALKFLAKRAGIEIPEDTSHDNEPYRSSSSKERLYELNKAAAKFFVDELKKSAEAQKYIAERKLSSSLIRHFGIGYAPNNFNSLTKHLLSLGYTYNEMSEAFLSKKSENTGKYFDIFRNRIMFPVIDVSGNVIAFGGRIIGDEKPKYINTSDTPVFSKRKNVFALNYARKSCAEQLILCEGYMDVVSLHGAGFENAIATCGTAITPEQARLMKKYTKSVVISYDSDEAGQRAADKAFELLGDAGLEVRILNMEGAKDPDEYVKKFGAAAFRKVLDDTSSKFEFKYRSVIRKYDVTTSDGKVKAVSDLANIISEFPSAVQRSIYIKDVSTRLSIPEDSFAATVNSIIKRNTKKIDKEQTRQVVLQTEGYGDRINPERLNNTAAVSTEEAIVGILATYPELINQAVEKIGLAESDFISAFNKRVFSTMLNLRQDFDIGMLGEEYTPEEISRIVSCMASRQPLTHNDLGELKICTERMREIGMKKNGLIDDLIAAKREKEKNKKKQKAD